MKSWFIQTVLIFVSFLQYLYPCTSIIVGKDASTDGSVLLGHNEDGSGCRIVNVWRVNQHMHAPTDSVTLISGIKIPQIKKTWAYLWFQMNGLAYSDCYMNEWGVAVASNACPSKLDSTVASGRIGYMLRRIIAERAQSAKEGVRIAGMLLDSLGYVDYGRTLIVCDPNEAWLISMLGGKYWTACRVPDNGVVGLSNQFVFRNVNFEDKKNWMFSKNDIRQLALDQGWYDPENSEEFDFSVIFSIPPQNDLRQWRVQQLVTAKTDTMMKKAKRGFPFAVYPKKKISYNKILSVLRDHYDKTIYEKQTADSTGMNPNRIIPQTICTSTTQYSIVAQLRNWLPWPASGLFWICFGRPDCHPFLPWYSAIDSIPDYYQNTPHIESPDSALAYHFNPVPGTFRYDPHSAFWIQNELENIIDMNYHESLPQVTPVRQAIETRLIAFQQEFESSMLRLWKKDPDSAGLYCRELLVSATEETLQKTIQMIKWLKTRNFR
ncbi:C69 family dipeptidase [bacterium]|nr:C69 family dipeptidase [bacterium]